ncbi:MAG: aminopeptidase [Bacteroidales bacterium]|nr:aminopeptidase [Bacteroidales bacterium]
MNTKSFAWILAAFFMFGQLNLSAQDKNTKNEKGYHFTDEVVVPHTSVKNQYRSGTCWSYSGIGLVEDELLRTTGKKYDLSEMFCVNHTYSDKAVKYVRLHGKLNFGPGAEIGDVLRVIKQYGMVPQEAYTGMQYGTKLPVQNELDAVLQDFVDAIVKDPNHKITPVWHNAFDAVLDTYLGPLPKTFTYEGKEYTPESFRDMTGFNPDDITNFTSFMNHPYDKPYQLEIPDNWLWADYMNVSMEDMMKIIDNALKNGYTVGWGADVSDRGFNWKEGVAIVPAEHPELKGSDQAKWEALSQREKQKMLYNFDSIVQEATITPEMRQEHYNNYQTTDDHGMVIVGIAKDQKGDIFYKIKNSWGTDQKYHGYFYASKAYVELQTVSFSVNKQAVPKDIRKKIGIK